MKKLLLILSITCISLGLQAMHQLPEDYNPFLQNSRLTECTGGKSCKIFRKSVPYELENNNQSFNVFFNPTEDTISLRDLHENKVAQLAQEQFSNRDEISIAFFGSTITDKGARLTIEKMITINQWENKVINVIYIDPENVIDKNFNYELHSNTLTIKTFQSVESLDKDLKIDILSTQDAVNFEDLDHLQNKKSFKKLNKKYLYSKVNDIFVSSSHNRIVLKALITCIDKHLTDKGLIAILSGSSPKRIEAYTFDGGIKSYLMFFNKNKNHIEHAWRIEKKTSKEGSDWLSIKDLNEDSMPLEYSKNLEIAIPDYAKTAYVTTTIELIKNKLNRWYPNNTEEVDRYINSLEKILQDFAEELTDFYDVSVVSESSKKEWIIEKATNFIDFLKFNIFIQKPKLSCLDQIINNLNNKDLTPLTQYYEKFFKKLTKFLSAIEAKQENFNSIPSTTPENPKVEIYENTLEQNTKEIKTEKINPPQEEKTNFKQETQLNKKPTQGTSKTTLIGVGIATFLAIYFGHNWLAKNSEWYHATLSKLLSRFNLLNQQD